jgi:hypothetical protein
MTACDVAGVVMAEFIVLAGDAENRLQMLLDYILASVSRQQFGHDLGFVLADELPQRIGNQSCAAQLPEHCLLLGRSSRSHSVDELDSRPF